MKIAIAGIGGVGGYIGAKLIEAKKEVTLIARGENLKKIQTDGLKLIDIDKEIILKPKSIIDKPKIIFDVIFLTVKSYSFEEIVKVLKDCIDEHTIIIPLANGVNNAKELEKLFDKGIICNGCVYIISNIQSEGVIKRVSDTFYLIFGREDNSYSERLKEIEEILNSANLKSKFSDNINYDVWKKYLFISSFATLTSYYKMGMGYIANEKEAELRKVLNEIKLVANSLNIPISDEDLEKVIKQGKSVPVESKTSMQIDFENHKESEVEALTGFIVQKAKELNLNVPFMSEIYEKLLKESK